MKLAELYALVVKYGIKADPRGALGVKKYLDKSKQDYKKLKGFKRQAFDKECFSNPFSDTRVLYGDKDIEVKKVLVGVDIETGEILLADKIREREGLDLVFTHHPEGKAYAALDEVMHVQKFLFNKLGIKEEVVKDFMDKRIQEVARRISGANHNRPIDTARLLDMPFMSCHTPADNHVAGYLQSTFDKFKPKKAGDVLNILAKIPEYKDALIVKAGPRLIAGKETSPAGKVFVDMTGGTEGTKELYGRLSQAGVGTICCMHLSEEHFAKAKEEHINIVIAGHIASDNLGLNLILDNIEKHAKLDIIGCSGFRRVRR